MNIKKRWRLKYVPERFFIEDNKGNIILEAESIKELKIMLAVIERLNDSVTIT